MYPFFESIKCLNGSIYNLRYHEERMQSTRLAAYGLNNKVRIRRRLVIPADCRRGLYKCRISYGLDLGPITFSPYHQQLITSIRPVTIDYSYPYKTNDREMLQASYQERDGADEVLLVREGLITDTSYHNVVCWYGDKRVTPEVPLLPGTMRAKLLRQGRIHTGRLTLDDLRAADQVGLINALNPLGKVVLQPSVIL